MQGEGEGQTRTNTQTDALLPLMMELGAMVSTMRVWARLSSPAFSKYQASSSTLEEKNKK